MLTTDEVLTRGVEKILPDKKGLAALMAKKKITLYQGFDPSMPSLHLGNFVGLMKLSQFQKLGHKVIFLVGDFTGMIGDPTDKLATRKQLTRDEVRKNAQDWMEQAGRVLDFDGPNAAELKFNSDWNDKVSFKDLIEITSNFTVQQMLERDMFAKRLAENKPIHLHEFLYPVAQGYDSVVMDIDLEVGGSDQLFNLLAGRTLMKAMRGKEKYVLTTKLLVDKDGNKVGKTTGNALFLDSTPENFFAGVMSFPDEVIALGFELLTEVDLAGITEKIARDPMEEKKRLAYEVVKTLWGEAAATAAQATFRKTFQEKKLPENIKTVKVEGGSLPLLDLVFATGEVTSRSEAGRLIAQNAVEVDGVVKSNPTEQIEVAKKGSAVRIGKTRFVKLIAK